MIMIMLIIIRNDDNADDNTTNTDTNTKTNTDK